MADRTTRIPERPTVLPRRAGFVQPRRAPRQAAEPGPRPDRPEATAVRETAKRVRGRLAAVIAAGVMLFALSPHLPPLVRVIEDLGGSLTQGVGRHAPAARAPRRGAPPAEAARDLAGARKAERAGRIDEAGRLYAQAAAVTRKAGPHALYHADSLIALGGFDLRHHRYPQAEASYVEAIRVAGAAGPTGRRRLLGAEYRLGYLYHRQRRYPQAIEHYERALVLARSTLGKDHRTVVSLLEAEGAAHGAAGDAAKARARYEEALGIAERTLASNDRLRVYARRGVERAKAMQRRMQAQ